MKVLVTGSNGFVGHWLLRHLREQGDETVTLPDDLDIRDRKALGQAVAGARADGVIHLAAQANVPASWDDPAATLEVNVGGQEEWTVATPVLSELSGLGARRFRRA